MLKLKKIFKTIIIFVLVMLLICFIISLFNLFNNEITISEVFSKTGLYFLYTIGYGALEGDAVLQNVLAMVGIVALALMSTFLTINLFWRLDDVSLSKTVDFNNDTLTFHFNNNGRSICDVNASFIIYDEYLCENLGEPKEYSMPILLKNSHWNLKTDLNDTFWYKAIYDLLSTSTKKLYCTFSFVDTQNGQNSIKVQEIKKENIFRNNQMLEYEEFIKPTIINSNTLHGCENGSTVSLSCEDDFMNIHYNFNENATNDSFAMAFYNFHDSFLNLEKFNRSTTFLDFTGVSEKKLTLNLEIKDINGNVCAKILEFNDAPQNINIPISEITGDLEHITEICFTVFNKNNPNSNNFKVSNLRIITK